MRTHLAATLLLRGAAACGGDLDPGSGDAVGTGTGTLVVEGSARASPHQIDARTPVDFDTEFSVRVSLNQLTVTTGTVTITSATGKTTLTFVDNRWRGSAPGYDEVYVLDVVSGPDQVEGARVDGPDIHVFSKPAEGATIDTTMPLQLAWRREDQAESATLRTDNLDSIAIPDTGSYSLAPGALAADSSQARPNTLRLIRTNRVVPKGGAAGSNWTVTIDNAIHVVAQPVAL